VITLIYYAAPLSSMAEVIKTRNSASILLPLTLMNTLNAALWATYGVVCVWLLNCCLSCRLSLMCGAAHTTSKLVYAHNCQCVQTVVYLMLGHRPWVTSTSGCPTALAWCCQLHRLHWHVCTLADPRQLLGGAPHSFTRRK
jgi:uncharacterized protein with PQ loop repeat